MTRKSNRNKPCFCGSGLKFKRCHGSSSQSPPSKTAKQEGNDAPPRAIIDEWQKFLERRYLLDPRFRIWYFVPHPDQDLRDASPLQLYTPGILDTAAVFDAVARWPADIRELTAEPQDVLLHRIVGHIDRKVLPIQFSAFETIVQEQERPFLCVISTPESHEFVSRCIAPMRAAWLHISTADIPDAIDIDSVTPMVLRDFARTAIQKVTDDASSPFVRVAERQLSDPLVDERFGLDETERRHGVTLPNEAALQAFGYEFARLEYLVPNDPDAYVRASIRSAVLVEQKRDALIGTRRLIPNNRFILTVFSPAWSLRHRDLARDRLPPDPLSREIAVAWRSIVRQEAHYFTGNSADPAALANDERFQSLVAMRRREAAAYIASLATHASHDLTPVLRLEPRVNRVRTRLIDIGNCARGNSPHRPFKLRKLIARLSDALLEDLNPRYIDLLSQPRKRIEGLSLVTDLPLEFLPINGMPLNMLFDSSRIPVNPGNLSFGELIDHRTTELTHSQFSEVLVVRSFSKEDRLRFVLERSIAAFSKRAGELPSVRIIDVNSAEEFVRAVNDYSGAVMIFDGHGSHNPDNHTSPIVVGGNPMDVWLYRHELKVPPIVVLSACDTAPLDGAHGSAAVGFLNAGARTVLGTVLPIQGSTAGAFIARLLYRIAMFLPQAARFSDRPLEWRGFLAGLLRMSHVSDLVHDAMARFDVPDKAFREVQMVANTFINKRDPAWHSHVAEQMRLSLPSAWYAGNPGPHPLNQLTDAMKYVQMGHPELIQIVADTTPASP